MNHDTSTTLQSPCDPTPHPTPNAAALSDRLLEACLKTLRALFQAHSTSATATFTSSSSNSTTTTTTQVVAHPSTLLVQLLHRPFSPNVAALAASLIARIISHSSSTHHLNQLQQHSSSHTSTTTMLFIEQGLLPRLLAMITPPSSSTSTTLNHQVKMQEAALDAMAACCKANPTIATTLSLLQGNKKGYT